jgi:hypothetical protein
VGVLSELINFSIAQQQFVCQSCKTVLALAGKLVMIPSTPLRAVLAIFSESSIVQENTFCPRLCKRFTLLLLSSL